jgi:cytochrome b561
MQLKNDAYRYGALAQLFHWAIVALIITQFVLANQAEALPLGPAKIATLATHKSIGMTSLAQGLRFDQATRLRRRAGRLERH